MAEEANDRGGDPSSSSSSFHALPHPKKTAFSDSLVKENLKRWGLDDTLKVLRFRYDRSYHKAAADQMLLEMFNDPGFRETFRVRFSVQTRA